MNAQRPDLELLEAVRAFTLDHAHPQVARFHAAMRNWGEQWEAVEASSLAVADQLEAACDSANPETGEFLQAFVRHRDHLRWEQSYRKGDGLVPDAMLDAYGFAEIIGARGPFVSERIRAGIAIWGPGIVYPRHQHQAEEVYILLSGSARFKLDDKAETSQHRGDIVFVASNTPHAFCCGDEGLVVCYLWQAGDLRQASTFDQAVVRDLC
ncbi:MAG: cupin domain-containing protein [Gammaproteobacteria bacterium]|nr:cupin domain-containing protein [Gammaproteobacteria bacterium]